MNRVERLAELFGSKNRLADAMNVDRSVVTRLAAMTGKRPGYGKIPTRYNQLILLAAKMQGFEEEAAKYLDMHVCPCCHQPLEPGQTLDPRIQAAILQAAKPGQSID